MEPVQKKMIAVAAVAGIFALSVAYMMFGRSTTVVAPSTVKNEVGSSVKPGTSSVDDPFYREQVARYNAQQSDAAKLGGKTSVALLNPDEKKGDSKLQQQQQQQQPHQQRQDTAQFDQLVQRKFAYLEMLKEESKANLPKIASLEVQVDREGGLHANQGGATQGQAAAMVMPTLAEGGLQIAATLDQELDTDIKSEVFATARGGKLDGAQFQGVAQRQKDFIRVSFTKMFFQGKTYQVAAVGMDPDTGHAVLSGEVDNRYMERFGWPFLVALVGGAGEAASKAATTVQVAAGGAMTASTTDVTGRQVAGKAVQAGAQSLSQAIAAEGRVEKVVRRAADAIVIRFLGEVKAQQGDIHGSKPK